MAAWQAGLPWGVLALVLAGCNGLTGIDSLTFSGTDASTGSSSGGSSGGSGSGGSSGGGSGGDSGSDGALPCRPEAGNQCTSEGRGCGTDSCGNPCGGCDGGLVCTGADSGAASATYQCIDQSVGCADGTREGFTNETTYPQIASCAASWQMQSMRSTRTGAWCGNDLGMCTVPEDACSPGWHVCMKNGWPGDLTSRVSAADCKSPVAGPNSYFVASSIQAATGTFNDCTLPLPCGGGSYPDAIACGAGATAFRNGYVGCVWPSQTPIGSGNQSCAAVGSMSDGVLCCKDPPLTGTGPGDAGSD